MKKWEFIESHEIHKDQWISLRADTCRHPSGKLISPFYVLEESDWVHIVARKQNGDILVTKQYRYAADSMCLEIPCGVIEPGEEPLQAAKRELLEETGCQATIWRLVGSPYANPARQTNRIYVYLAEEISTLQKQKLDDQEDIEFSFMSEKELIAKTMDGDFPQALHICSLLLTLKRVEPVAGTDSAR